MRKIASYEDMIESGCGMFIPDVRTPEKTLVYALVPAEALITPHVAGPHLVDPEQAKDFQKQVIEDGPKPSRGSNLFNK